MRHARRASGKKAGREERGRPAPVAARGAARMRGAAGGGGDKMADGRAEGDKARRPQQPAGGEHAAPRPGREREGNGKGARRRPRGVGGAGGAAPGRAVRGRGLGPPQGWPRPLRSGAAAALLAPQDLLLAAAVLVQVEMQGTFIVCHFKHLGGLLFPLFFFFYFQFHQSLSFQSDFMLFQP